MAQFLNNPIVQLIVSLVLRFIHGRTC